MFSALINAAKPHILGIDTPEQRTAKLAIDVRRRMQQYENRVKSSDQTCVGLYCHWFLSVIALMESAARLLFHVLIVVLWVLLYYIIVCLSCGKAEVSNILTHQMSRCSLYSGLFFSMLGNILRPWNPMLYMFQTASTLSRPYVTGIYQQDIPTPFDVENFVINDCLCCCCNCFGCKRGHCVCCGSPPEATLPPYKLAQAALFCVGCCKACGCHQCTGGKGMDAAMTRLHEELLEENMQATQAFYAENYQCDSFDGLVAREIYGNREKGRQPHASAAPMPQQPYPMQQTIPVVIARPVS